MGDTVAVGTDGEGTPHELTATSIITESKPVLSTLIHLIKTS